MAADPVHLAGLPMVLRPDFAFMYSFTIFDAGELSTRSIGSHVYQSHL